MFETRIYTQQFGNVLLKRAAIMEDDIPRDGGRIPEYGATMVLRFDSYDSGVLHGRLESFCFREPFPFTGLDQLLLTMESIMDKLDYPQAQMLLRSIRRERICDDIPVAAAPFIQIPDEMLTKEFSRLAQTEIEGEYALLLRVYSRQNASMQGMIRRDGGDIPFRSALELLSLLHECAKEYFQSKNKS